MLSAKEIASSEYQRQFGEWPPIITLENPSLNDDGTTSFSVCVVSEGAMSNNGA